VRVIGEVLRGFSDVRLAILFGSRARGSARPGSDVDLAIDAPAAVCGALGATLTSALGAEVDLVRLEMATVPLLEALIADGIVAHEAQPGAGAAWRSRTLAQLETDRPWYRRQRDAWLARVASSGFADDGVEHG
jgi:predicted nucleotidyltransferase